MSTRSTSTTPECSDQEETKTQRCLYDRLESKINSYLDAQNLYISAPSPKSPTLSAAGLTARRKNSIMQRRIRLMSANMAYSDSPESLYGDRKFCNLQVNVLAGLTKQPEALMPEQQQA